ncbi:hypothetical protein KY284_011013 [Solanum tuberosum]|nr:hypothetical protein KY284_011013 [Solanum tuberosum]
MGKQKRVSGDASAVWFKCGSCYRKKDEGDGVLFFDEFRVVFGEIRGRRWLLCLMVVAWCYLYFVTVELSRNDKRKMRKWVWVCELLPEVHQKW